MSLCVMDNHKDLKLYENIKNDVNQEYKNLSTYHIKSIIDEKYIKLGGKFKNDTQIDNMANYVKNLSNTNNKEEKTNLTSIELIKKLGQKKFIALKLCKEIDPNGFIDWSNGRFIESGDIKHKF